MTVPWYGLQSTPRWSSIRVIPLPIGGYRRSLIDIVLNVALYVPFGYWMIRPDKAGAARIGKVIAAAFLLSLFAEASQIFDPILNRTAIGFWSPSTRIWTAD